MNARDYLTVWGHLQAYKNHLGDLAREVAETHTEAGKGVAITFLQVCTEITELQAKLQKEAEALSEWSAERKG